VKSAFGAEQLDIRFLAKFGGFAIQRIAGINSLSKK
jgi:hypothetical protein